MEGKKRREGKGVKERDGICREREKVKGWKGIEERRKASQDGICIEKKGGKAWKEMNEKKREWMERMERKKVKGCKEMNGREGRFN